LGAAAARRGCRRQGAARPRPRSRRAGHDPGAVPDPDRVPRRAAPGRIARTLSARGSAMPGENRVNHPVLIAVESSVIETPRVAQVRGIFDLKAETTSRLEWTVRLPLHEKDWHVGLVVGPSGCGKSTIARALWPRETAAAAALTWPADRSILDAFPPDLAVKDVTALLSAVRFSSPPAWLRPFHVLSTGQQFRVTFARLLAASAPLVVLDEYSSVVDRTVAQIGSAALAKTVRGRGQRFIAVTCHEDVEAWLQPDWVYRPAEELFAWRCLRRQPAIAFDVVRCQASAWELFAPHHYLSRRHA